MVLMIEKDTRGGICYAILRYGKGNDKYLNDYDKNQNYPFLNIGMSIIYMVGRNY